MNALPLTADLGNIWDASKAWVVPAMAGCWSIMLFLLTRRSNRADIVRGQATQVEQLYIGKAEGLFTILQDELRSRNARIGAMEAERETLRSSLSEERQMFQAVKQRHAELLTFLATAGIKVPDELHL